MSPASPAPEPCAVARPFAGVGDVRRHLLEELRRAMGWDAVFLARVRARDLEIDAVAGDTSWLAPGTTVPLEDSLCYRMLDGAPAVTDSASDPGDPYHDAPARRRLGIESYSGHLIRDATGAPLGTLCVIDRRSRPVSDEARRLGETFARVLGWDLTREQMLGELTEARRRLSVLAATDPLTGLLNRRSFEERLAAEIAAATSSGRALSLAMLDLDHFKAVNDDHGHAAGDAVLREAAGRLRATLRRGDAIARIGGEEFAWIMPGATGAEAAAVCDRARAALTGRAMPPAGRLTVSIGVCDLGPHARGAEELVRLADRALYRAKAEGRDRVRRHMPDGAVEWRALGGPPAASPAEIATRAGAALGWAPHEVAALRSAVVGGADLSTALRALIDA